MKKDQKVLTWSEIDPYAEACRQRRDEWEAARQRRADRLFTFGPELAELPEWRYDEFLANRQDIDHGLTDLFADQLERANADFAERKREAQWKVQVCDRLGEPIDDHTRQMAEAESAQPAVDKLVAAISRSRRAASFQTAGERSAPVVGENDPRWGPWQG